MARVALVCEPPDGGVAEHVAQLALGLPDHGHEAVVLAPACFAPAERLRAAGTLVQTLPFRREYSHPLADARAFAALVRAVRASGAELVHAHAAKAGVLARAAATATGRPAVYTPHCFPFVGEIAAARRRFAGAVECALGPLTDAIVCVCEAERELAEARRIRPRTELAVVHNGCPAADPGVAIDPRLAALRERGPVIGAVSVLRRQKRIDVLLAAAPRVLAAVPDASIVVVGGGPEEARLRALSSNVHFFPFEQPSARALRALDLYVLSSGWEAFPIAVLEAQACGVPQVAADVGGVGEAVTPDTGVLVPPGDPQALARALIDLLRDPGRRAAMASASRARHAERFRAELMVARTAELYERVLARRSRRRFSRLETRR
jgi:glycosyltransferase involved in cell wall biosynthesis